VQVTVVQAGSSTAAAQTHAVDSEHWANSETTAWEMLHSSISKPASITFFHLKITDLVHENIFPP